MKHEIASLVRLAKTPLSALRRRNARPLLAALLNHDSADVRRLGEALRDTLDGALAPQEESLLAAIERRRAALLDSTGKISVIDYGAGGPGSNRSREEMDQGVPFTARIADVATVSKPKFLATLLFNLVRKVKPASCVELGSCVGISAAYQATALKLNGTGQLVTMEGSPEVAKLAQETFDTLQLGNVKEVCGPFHKTLDAVLAAARPIDYFFNDGHHDRDAVLRYFEQAMPYLASNAVVVFDDISWSPGMREAWRAIEDDQRVAATIDLGTMGIALMGKSARKERHRIPL